MSRSPACLPALLALPCLLAACASAPTPNRDLHGPADVEDYIRRLESAERVERLRPDEVVAALQPAADARIADVGCGPGVFALRFAQAAPRGVVYAVDVEPRQLDALRGHLLQTGTENVVPVLASYSNPHLPPGGVDLIFIADTYHHLEDRVAYLGVLKEDMAPGGRLAIFEYLPGDLPVGPPADHKLSREQRFAELEEAGWRLERSFDSHEYHDFEIWRAAP